MIDFQPWPKIARLNRDVVVTEKIDGTNAAVVIEPFPDEGGPFDLATVDHDGQRFNIGAQSRKRIITPDDDNFGFARWVQENAQALVELLGPGRHFGEWWGSGIQRGYGLTKGEKRFSLFNVARHGGADFSSVAGLGVVPTLYHGPFDTESIEAELNLLAHLGSFAAPGFMDPEGIVVWHEHARQSFKVTIKDDAVPKSAIQTAA